MCLQNPTYPQNECCRNRKDGRFKVKTCYNNLLRRMGGKCGSWSWRTIKKTIIHPRAECFTWIGTPETCLTHDNLQKRGLIYAADAFDVKS